MMILNYLIDKFIYYSIDFIFFTYIFLKIFVINIYKFIEFIPNIFIFIFDNIFVITFLSLYCYTEYVYNSIKN
jgi:hypothetical protein